MTLMAFHLVMRMPWVRTPPGLFCIFMLFYVFALCSESAEKRVARRLGAWWWSKVDRNGGECEDGRDGVVPSPFARD